ncbi:MAG: GHMP kinase [Armatimonadetes bacterium]|nr:GHMP kinase [Armatimonadota bacterium]MDW8121026.1 galactokinase family protein [Armatimonadota bacterium]
MARWISQAPGRICLFGEHQDYLGLPVIAAAIDLHIRMEASARSDRRVFVTMPDIGEEEVIDLDQPIIYDRPRQYLRSGLKVIQDQGFVLPHGLNVTVRGDIPINAGTSSSSAFVIAWLKLLLKVCQAPLCDDAELVARLGHRAEVVEFGEPGGMMDHFASAYGGLIFVDTRPPFQAQRLPCPFERFVLVDSLERKQTLEVLRSAKELALASFEEMKKRHPTFDVHKTLTEEALAVASQLPEPLSNKAEAQIRNRNLCREAYHILSGKNPDLKRIGRMLTEHHRWLTVLGVSTPRLNRLVEVCLAAGALGAKLNGSGGGGCLFALAPGREEQVAAAAEREGARSYIVRIASGAEVVVED